jgi:hypothetical protein
VLCSPTRLTRSPGRTIMSARINNRIKFIILFIYVDLQKVRSELFRIEVDISELLVLFVPFFCFKIVLLVFDRTSISQDIREVLSCLLTVIVTEDIVLCGKRDGFPLGKSLIYRLGKFVF